MTRIFIVFALVSAVFQSAAQPIHRGPYLSCVTDSSIVITWQTRKPAPSLIQYGRTSSYGETVTGIAPTEFHSYMLTGLKPGTEYHYRVISGDTTKEYSFTTAPAAGDPVMFIAYGDTRTDRDAHVSVLRAIAAHHPGLILNSGDLVGSNTDDNWDHYYEDFCVHAPIGPYYASYASPGNHESGAMYYRNLVLPANNPAGTEAYYSFDYGSVHIMSINTEIPYDPGTPQYEWILSDLASPAAARARFIVAFWHRPPYSSSNHGSDLKARAVLSPLMEKHGVDLVFNGHDHCYERTLPFVKTTYVVTGGGGAPLYDFKTTNAWTACKEKAYHFCTIEVKDSTLRMTMIRADGAVRDSLVIKK